MKTKLKLTLNKVNFRGMALMALLLLALGGLSTWLISKDVDRKMREELLHETLLVGQAVNVNLVKSFTATEADLGSADYQRLRGQLSMILKSKNHCKYLYLMGRKAAGDVFFFLDTDEADAAAPGEIYNKASKELKAMFDNGLPLVEGPLPDDWGTWITALVPVKDDVTGKLIAVLGMDIDARTWKWDVASRASWPAGLMLAFLILTGSGILVARSRAEESIRVSEARLRRAEFASKSGNWELHLKSQEITVSEGAIKIYGIDKARFDYSALKKISLPEYRPIPDSALKKLIEDDQPYDIEFKIKTANTGEIKDIHSVATFDKEKRIIFGIIQDITERKKIEDALKVSEASLREINATKDKFFSIISHDLKNPFNAIIGFSDVLAEQLQEKNYEGIAQYAEIIHGSSRLAMDLLTNLLEWSRSQSGRMEFAPRPVEMVALINENVELLGGSAQQKSITISSKLPPEAKVFADKAMISAVLRNLVSNAVKFTNPGGKIVILAQTTEKELTVSIGDNGVGITKEGIENLFRIDENHSTLGTQNEKGTGLGLILCKEFIEKHGGKIWVESEVGRGSTFYFSIPKI